MEFENLTNILNITKEQFFEKLERPELAIKKAVQRGIDLNGQSPEDFQCIICQGLLYLPKECQTCEIMLCNQCIETWIEKGSSQQKVCPQCKSQIKTKELNRNLSKVLDKILINGCHRKQCKLKNVPMTYEKFVKHHQRDCEYIKVQCPIENCRETFRYLNWEEHFNTCYQIIFSCNKCAVTIHSYNKAHDHDCISALQEENKMLKSNHELVISILQVSIEDREKELQAKIAKQKSQIESLKEKLKQQELSNKAYDSKIHKLENANQELESFRQKYHSVEQELNNLLRRPKQNEIGSNLEVKLSFVHEAKNVIRSKKFMNDNQMFKSSGLLYCMKDKSMLLFQSPSYLGVEICDSCKLKFRIQAWDKSIEYDEYYGYQCEECKFTICQVCVKRVFPSSE